MERRGTGLSAGEHVGAGGDDGNCVFLGVRWELRRGGNLDGCRDNVTSELDVFKHYGVKFSIFELGFSEMRKEMYSHGWNDFFQGFVCHINLFIPIISLIQDKHPPNSTTKQNT